MTIHMLFAPTGTLKSRGRNYLEQHAKLRREVALARHKTKQQRKRERSARIKQQGSA